MKVRQGTFLLIFLPIYLVCNNVKAQNFGKIIFHTSICFGSCPVYHLEIDGDKNVKLNAETIFKEKSDYEQDPQKEGFFAGKLSDRNFNRLTILIKTTGLNKLKFNGVRCCDGSLITIIFYHNGKRKYLESMFPPENARPLIGFLYQICQTNSFRKVTMPLDIEPPEPPKPMRIVYPPKLPEQE